MKPLVRALEALVVLGMATVSSVVVIEVALRYLLGRSLIVTEELSSYLMVWIVFIAGALGILDDAHIRIDVAIRRLPARLRRLAEALALALSLAFLGTLGYAAARILPDQAAQETVTLGISMAWPYLAIPVGCALMAAFLIARAWRGLRQSPGK